MGFLCETTACKDGLKPVIISSVGAEEVKYGCAKWKPCYESPDICGKGGAGTCEWNKDPAEGEAQHTCKCAPGYKHKIPGDPSSPCVDIDECEETVDENGNKVNPCGLGNCTNTDGSYTCECEPRATLDLKNNTCKDVDECKDPTICGVDDEGNLLGNCTDLNPGYRCDCRAGYEFRDGTCREINECVDEHGNPTGRCGEAEEQCVNHDGKTDKYPNGYECICNEGFEFDNVTCVDVNECKVLSYKVNGYEVPACVDKVRRFGLIRKARKFILHDSGGWMALSFENYSIKATGH